MSTNPSRHPIRALWCVIRSRSTAFERMMEQRGDHRCHHEPFGDVWYNGEEPHCPPNRVQNPTPGLTIASRLAEVLADADESPVFFKDMSEYVLHLADDDFLGRFEHSFLIRDPARTVPSIFDKWPDFALSETGFAEQHELFDRVTALRGSPPPVIDAEDLMADTPGLVAAWCRAVDIDFRPEALEWEAEVRDYSWYDGGAWHDNLRTSTGLVAPDTDYLPVEADQRMVDAYEACLPHYEAMAVHRLRA